MHYDIIHYFDYKSPYAYLAQEELFELTAAGELTVEWRPYTLEISKYLGTAKVDPRGNVLEQTRNDHQWRRVKYAYMDCRREANRRGITVRGPRKIFNSEISHVGFLYACQAGDFRAYHNHIFEKFWLRELDIEDVAIVRRVLDDSGIDSSQFEDYLAGEGARLYRKIIDDAEAAGIFGVPSYLVGDEIFWGAERFPRAVEAARRRRQ